MKLVSYKTARDFRAGVVVDGRIFDVRELLKHPEPIADVQALFGLGEAALNTLRARLAAPGIEGLSPSEHRLGPPVLRPPSIRDFMAYEGHATMGGQWEMPAAYYRLPVFYFSNPLCLYGHEEAVPMPSATEKLDYELEIAAVICREGSDIPASEALSYIGGFTIFNDWSARDLQRDEMQCHLGPAKGKDAASSLGPWVVTLDELAPRFKDGQLHSRCTLEVNGVQWVQGNASGMLHDWAAMIERASRDSRVVPGDLICSGTIEGGSIPEAMRRGLPARYLREGDRVTISVEGLGQLASVLAPRRQSADGYRFAAPARKVD